MYVLHSYVIHLLCTTYIMNVFICAFIFVFSMNFDSNQCHSAFGGVIKNRSKCVKRNPTSLQVTLLTGKCG